MFPYSYLDVSGDGEYVTVRLILVDPERGVVAANTLIRGVPVVNAKRLLAKGPDGAPPVFWRVKMEAARNRLVEIAAQLPVFVDSVGYAQWVELVHGYAPTGVDTHVPLLVIQPDAYAWVPCPGIDDWGNWSDRSVAEPPWRAQLALAITRTSPVCPPDATLHEQAAMHLAFIQQCTPDETTKPCIPAVASTSDGTLPAWAPADPPVYQVAMAFTPLDLTGLPELDDWPAPAAQSLTNAFDQAVAQLVNPNTEQAHHRVPAAKATSPSAAVPFAGYPALADANRNAASNLAYLWANTRGLAASSLYAGIAGASAAGLYYLACQIMFGGPVDLTAGALITPSHLTITEDLWFIGLIVGVVAFGVGMVHARPGRSAYVRDTLYNVHRWLDHHPEVVAKLTGPAPAWLPAGQPDRYDVLTAPTIPLTPESGRHV